MMKNHTKWMLTPLLAIGSTVCWSADLSVQNDGPDAVIQPERQQLMKSLSASSSDTTSQFQSPTPSDVQFVVTKGGDLHVQRSTGQTISIPFDINRVFGNPDKLLKNGALPQSVILRMIVWDVDSDAASRPEEDHVYVNGNFVGILSGHNQTWTDNTFVVPTHLLHLKDEASTGMNMIEVEVDVNSGGWVTKVDWVSIAIPAPPPVVIAHGIRDSAAGMKDLVAAIEDLGLPVHVFDFNNHGNDSIKSGGRQLAREVAAAKSKFNVEHVNIVAHSMGGLKAREYVEAANDVAKVLQIATPNAGAPMADVGVAVKSKLPKSLSPPVNTIMKSMGGIGIWDGAIKDLASSSMKAYNENSKLNSNVYYRIVAGAVQGKFDDAIYSRTAQTYGHDSFHPGDGIVPLWSAHSMIAPYGDSPIEKNEKYASHTGLVTGDGVRNVVNNFLRKDLLAPKNADRVNDPVTLAESRSPRPQKEPYDESYESRVYYLDSGIVNLNYVSVSAFELVGNKDATVMLEVCDCADASVMLIDPAGTEYSETSGNVTVSKDAGVAVYSVKNPTAGRWQVSFSPKKIITGESSAPYIVMVTENDSLISIDAKLESRYVKAGNPFIMTAVPAVNGETMQGTVAVVAMCGQTVTTNYLNDSGISPDKTAGDGRFTGSIGTEDPGEYEFLVVFSSTSPIAFKRSATLSGVAYASDTKLSDVSFGAKDLNANGLYDEMTVNIGVDVQMATSYKVIATLGDVAGNPIAESCSSNVFCTVGARAVPVSFRGTAIYEHGACEGYKILKATLIECGEESDAVIDVRTNLSSTAVYSYDQFEHPLITLAPGSVDVARDEDGDGIFDVLEVNMPLMVDSTKNGSYKWSAALCDSDGKIITFSTGTVELKAGTGNPSEATSLMMSIPASVIAAGGKDGPYVISNILLWNDAESLSLAGRHVTKTYSVVSFGGMQVSSASVYGVSATARWPFNGLVDVDFTLETAPAGTKANVQINGFDRDLNREKKAYSVTGKGKTFNAGVHRITWDVGTDYPQFHSAAFEIKVSAEAIAGTSYSSVLGNPPLVFKSGGDAEWETMPVDECGDSVAQSGSVSQGESSWLEAVVDGPGTLEFDWRVVRGDSLNTFEFLVDGIRWLKLGGKSGWQTESVFIPSGKHVVRWNYVGNSNEVGLRAKLDRVAWEGTQDETGGIYMVVDLSEGPNATNYPVSYTKGVPNGGWTEEYKTEKLVLRKIEPGEFVMTDSRYGRVTNELVQITTNFYIGVFELTQRQWELVMGTRPSHFCNDQYYASRPVEKISYGMIRGNSVGAHWPSSAAVDAESFMGRLREKTNKIFDLPTEAQWEYACRAGTTSDFNNGQNLTSNVDDTPMNVLGRYYYNGGDGYDAMLSPTGGTAIVGSYAPNDWGLYDMHGNVYELCLDWYQTPIPFDSNPVCDPKGPSSGEKRIVRGGARTNTAAGCESAIWSVFLPSETDSLIGCRLCCAGAGVPSDVVPLPVAVESTYMVVDLSGGANATTYPVSYLDDVPNGGWTDEYKTTKLVLRRIANGSFMMGSPADELGRGGDEDWHHVTLGQSFYIGVFQVTQKQYEMVMGTKPAYYKGDMRPVEGVSYNAIRGSSEGAKWPMSNAVDAVSFMGRIRARTGLNLDLPTEAQWEYACRAGTTTALNSGKNLTNANQDEGVNEVGRYGYNNGCQGGIVDGKGGYSSNHTTVGSYRPNAWGLYDMHGNVWEWCVDWYKRSLGTSSVTDPCGGVSGAEHVLRGGCWYTFANICRSACRASAVPSNVCDTFGFRICCPAGQSQNQVTVTFDANGGAGTMPPVTVGAGGALAIALCGFTRDGCVFAGWTTSPSDDVIYLQLQRRLVDRGATSALDDVVYADGATIPSVTSDMTLYAKWAKASSPFDHLYVVVDLSAGANATSYPVSYLDDVPSGGWTDEYKTKKLVLRRIENGSFMMGSPANELERSGDETRHSVAISQPFYIGVFEVTQKQWELVMGTNPSSYKGETRPVESVSYNMIRGSASGALWPSSSAVDATSFMGKICVKTGLAIDLPTEAQWEYACRAGTTTALNSGKDLMSTSKDANMDKVGRYGWNNGWLSGGTKDGKGGYSDYHTRVGSYNPNAWGLYDMHGNVLEWCLDWYGTYPSSPVTDPKGALSGSNRIYRGGAWDRGAFLCCSARRSNFMASVASSISGFRLCCSTEEAADRVIVSFDANGGTGTMPSVTVGAGGALAIVPCAFTRDGYDFAGWAASASGEVVYADSATIPSVTSNMTLYAKWTKKSSSSERLYMVVDLSAGANATSYPVSYLDDAPNGGWTDEYKTTKLVLRRIEPGTFTMGRSGSSDNPAHEVTLTKPFFAGVFEVTQKQYELVMGSNPSTYKGDKRPVDQITYTLIRGSSNGAKWPTANSVDATSFMGKIRTRTGLTFDLPTEAQWEYACRAGTTSSYNNGGSSQSDVMKLGRCNSNCSDGKGGYSAAHTTVGSYLPNAWGLYDMHGNIAEWCLDWYGDVGKAVDPLGPNTGTVRVIRGGSWFHNYSACASHYRMYLYYAYVDNSSGFRLFLNLDK